LPVDTLVEI